MIAGESYVALIHSFEGGANDYELKDSSFFLLESTNCEDSIHYLNF